MPLDGRFVRICYNITTSILSCSSTGVLALIKNNNGLAESVQSIPTNAQKGMKIFTTPIPFYTGDTLCSTIQNLAISNPTSVASTMTVFVHVLVEFDL